SSFDIYKKYKGLPRVLKGRLTKNNKVLPYYNRDDIDVKKKLDGKKLEIVWINSLVDVFFLQVQGSGIVELDTGERLRVNYAESNGHVYRSIGALMIRRGFLEREKVSMQSIRQYLEEHPEEVEEIFNFNPSYVFFRKVKEGPIGFMGVPVTAYRSIATDRKLFPRGGLCYIETELPVFD
ncbi:MAG: murein transglycosylase, partial [bacterium]|nr:murein transglycosylase [bacterium]